VQAFHRRFLLASFALTIAMVLGGAKAQAGYVSVATLSSQGGVSSLEQLGGVHEASSGMADAGNTACLPTERGGPDAPALPSSPSPKLPQKTSTLGHTCAGNPSRPGSGNSSSTPPPDNPQPSFVSSPVFAFLLPPQKGEVPPFSVASVPWHPPRAT